MDFRDPKRNCFTEQYIIRRIVENSTPSFNGSVCCLFSAGSVSFSPRSSIQILFLCVPKELIAGEHEDYIDSDQKNAFP